MKRTAALVATLLSVLNTPVSAAPPPITGTPAIDTPNLLLWPADRGNVTPNLNDPTSNVLDDLHGDVSSCDFVFSSEGNYHPALRDVWPIFLAKFKQEPLKNALYTTSPPVFAPQTQNGVLQFGNLYTYCRPQLAAGSMKAVRSLINAGQTVGEPIPFYQDRGNVILVKRGNPKHIQSVWDLARRNVFYVSPNPTLEPGAFGNYLNTIYGIASNDPKPPAGMTPDRLINAVFNDSRQAPNKWLAGARIHHRDVPWSIAYGKADAGLLLYHLARYTKQTFPDQFDIVPLGGTEEDPQPLPGSTAGVRYMIRVKGDWNERQQEATETFIRTLMSDRFTQILEARGLQRPPGFAPVE